MFAHQNPLPQYPRGVLKRYHEEEMAADLANGTAIGFNEHRNKRLHTLPLRTSPAAARKWALSTETTPPVQPSAITPPSSFAEDLSPFGVRPQQPPQLVAGSCDMDMDMAMDEPEHPLHGNDGLGLHLAPGPLQPDAMQAEAALPTIARRVPTPLQPNFAAQVRGSSWSHSAPGSSLRHPVLENGPANDMSSVPRLLSHGPLGDWSMVQNRSLPSPISESGAEADAMAYHSDGFEDGCGHDTNTLSTPVRPSSAAAMTAGSALAQVVADAALLEGDTVVLSSPKKGHSRSRHTLVAWTQQPGMKKSFSVGYRNDCEKCRNRVPGHFNHIILS